MVSEASDDGTDDIVTEVADRDPRVRPLRTRRYGFQAGPTNEALRETAGEVIAAIDHDDRGRLRLEGAGARYAYRWMVGY